MAERKSNFPKTRDELEAAGYRFSNYAICRGSNCKRDIEWWTTPTGKKMPIDRMPNPDSPAVPHWGTCPDAKKF